MVVSGVAVLTGLTRIKDPYTNFKHPFEGSYWNGNALSTAVVSLLSTLKRKSFNSSWYAD